ncbi:MAG: OmpL47-type beta-barrel domain-containing protein, partial [Bacteroidia bacterium]
TVHGEERLDYGSPISIPQEYGKHVLKYDAMDNVENLSVNEYLTVYMDNAAPETGIKFGRPQFFTRDTLFINSKTQVTLPSSDRGSGVTKTEYAIDGGGLNVYSGAFNIENHGHRTVTFKSTDCVNNVENLKTSKFFVDNKPPKIYNNFSIEPIGTKNGLKVYPNYTRLYLGATDRHVGTERILYSINGSKFSDYSSPQTLDISELNRFQAKKKYTVKVKAYDKLGNESESTIEFYVGRDED